VRAADTVARLGGDEFAAILSEVGSRREVEEVAERIVADLARPFILQAGTASISCSIGIALFPEHGRDSDSPAAQRRCRALRRQGQHAQRLSHRADGRRFRVGA
jgi:diguanylate cyclase (GGDEF)-like protein